MMRLMPRHRHNVPHGLAIVGALLLLASTVTGVGKALQPAPHQHAALVATEAVGSDAESAAPEPVDAVPHPAVKKKRFRVNLFLFRH